MLFLAGQNASGLARGERSGIEPEFPSVSRVLFDDDDDDDHEDRENDDGNYQRPLRSFAAGTRRTLACRCSSRSGEVREHLTKNGRRRRRRFGSTLNPGPATSSSSSSSLSAMTTTTEPVVSPQGVKKREPREQ